MRRLLQIIFSLIFLLPNFGFSDNLPDFGSSSTASLSSAQEQQLGKEFMRAVRQQLKLVDDPVVTEYIQSLGQRLVSHADTNGQKFHFFVVNNPSINAFAGPGGYIGINSGLILRTHNESELAAVIAHEIAHVTQKHIARGMENAKRMALPMIGALIAAMAAGGSDAGTGVATATIAAAQQHTINFTRANEEEADRIGIQTLYRAGFNPKSMAVFFKSIQHENGFYGEQLPEYLSTHPVSVTRITDALNRADQYPPRITKHYILYSLAKEKIRVDTTTTNQLGKLLNYYQAQLKNKSAAPLQYGYTLTLLKAHQLKKALEQINILLKTNPDELFYQLCKANIQLDSNQTNEAITTLENSLSLYPNNLALNLAYSKALVANNKAKKAVVVLIKQSRQHPNNIVLLQELSRTQAKAGNFIDAYETRGQLLAMLGYKKQAIQQLEVALGKTKKDSDAALRIKAQLEKLKKTK